MTDEMRWRYGDANPVKAAVDAETVVEKGDLLWQDVDDAKPAALFDDFGIATQRRFADVFLGIALWYSREGDTDPIRVATTGVFNFDCSGGMFELGDLVGVARTWNNAAGDKCVLTNQQVVKMNEARCAIGRVAKRESIAVTHVLVDIRSTVMTGGVFERKTSRR